MPQPNHRKPVIVFYDGTDPDGFFAAYAAYLAYQHNAAYVPLAHGTFSEQVRAEDVRGREVVVLDIALAEDELRWLNEQAADLRVIDHHVSSAAAYGRFHHRCLYDPQRCTAVLAWEHFHPTRGLPDVYLYVQDRDLWQWLLPYSREVSAAIRSYAWTWDNAEMMCASLNQLMSEGASILRRVNLEAQRAAANAFVARVGGYEVTVANCATFISETHEALHAQRLVDEQPFTATFVVLVDGSYRWDLRSHGDFDVGALARALGGGGHRAAAGFIAPPENPYAIPPQQEPEPAPKKKGKEEQAKDDKPGR